MTDWLSDAPYPSDVRHKLFDGEGSVEVWDLLARRPFEPFSAILACELTPGGSVGRHQQQRDPEIVLCGQGSGQIEVNGHERPFTPGELVLLPFGSTMAIRNSSTVEPLRYFIIKAQTPAS